MIKYELLKGKNILIIVKISDGLGNQMFQYAYAKTLQMNLPHKVYLDISDINNYRNNSLNNIKWRKLCDKRRRTGVWRTGRNTGGKACCTSGKWRCTDY